MVSARPLSALAVALLVGLPACAATPPATAPPPTPSTAATSGTASVYTLDGAEHRRPTDVDWHAESRTFVASTYNEGILYRGGLDDPLTPVFLRGQPGQTADGMRVAGGRIYVVASTEAQITTSPPGNGPARSPLGRAGTSSTWMSPAPGTSA